jgi:NADH:ubiquinone oxidoreductase subunit 6 (subunit J)
LTYNIVLLGLGFIVLLAGILTLESKELMHGAFFLGLLLVTLGEIYVLLGAEYVGIVQILIYGGGVTVLMLFALLFLPKRKAAEWPATFRALGVVASLLLVSLILFAIEFATEPVSTGVTSYKDLAFGLLTKYDATLLVVGLILFAVIVSAAYIAGERRVGIE